MANNITSLDVKRFVNYWNTLFPLDYWWRQKHHVAFNSQEHRNYNFIDQLFEFYEDQMMKSSLVKEKKSYDLYKPDRNDYLKKRQLTEKEVDDLFDKLGNEISQE
jgi:hypothetical protein